MRRLTLCLLLLGTLVVSGCGGSSSPGSGAGRASSGTPAASSVPAATTGKAVTKVLVVVVENHSLDQMRAQMPYTYGLARRFGYAAHYSGVTYPSLPNYIAITSGSTHGIADDDSPQAHRLGGPSVFGQALAHGRTAAVYADGMPSDCALSNGGSDYAVKHNPWAYYVGERAACGRYDVPTSRLPRDAAHGRLPNVGMVIPNMCHDAHDCPLPVADAWIRRTLTGVLAGPDWRSGHLAVVVTADTDDRKAGNRVLTVVVHPGQRHSVVSRPLDHYALSRLLSQVAHGRPLNRAAHAPSMAKAFGLRVG